MLVNESFRGRSRLALLAGAAPVAAGLCLAAPATVRAEDVRGQGVADRQYDAYAPQGVRVGSLVLRPSLTVSEYYDSNVFAVETGAIDDFVTELNPNLVVESDWSNHSLRLEADLDHKVHATESGEDATDWAVGAAARIDVLADTTLRAGLFYGALTEDRGAPDAIGSIAEPTQYEELNASLGLAQQFSRITSEVAADYTVLEFEDTPLVGGGVADNADRNRSVLDVAIEVGYELANDTIIFLRGTYNTRDYDLDVPQVPTNRDSHGYELVAGANFELGSLATGEVFAGYQEQSFDDPTFAPVSGVAFGAAVDWYVSSLTTVRLRADTSIEDTTSGGASVYERRRAGVGLDHEFLRNLIASLDLEYATEEYSGTDRDDQVYDAQFGIDYLFNRIFSAGLFYGYEERSSNVPGNSFSRSVGGVRVRSEL